MEKIITEDTPLLKMVNYINILKAVSYIKKKQKKLKIQKIHIY